jgi:hypothetical protein
MPVRKGPMTAIVSKSWRSMSFQPEQQWGFQLMLMYARQIDNAEKLKAELEKVLDEFDTINVKWIQRMERLERYIVADKVVTTTGPRLTDLMKEFGMTPGIRKTVVAPIEVQGGVESDGGSTAPAAEEGVADILQWRNERGRHTRRSG